MWTLGLHMKGWRADVVPNMSSKACSLFGALLGVCIDAGEYVTSIVGRPLVIAGRSIEKQCLRDAFPALQPRVNALDGGAQVSLALLLPMLLGCSNTPSTAAAMRQMCNSLFRDLVCFLAAAHELGRRDSAAQRGREALYLSMPVLRGPSGKIRRVSAGKKTTMVSVA